MTDTIKPMSEDEVNAERIFYAQLSVYDIARIGVKHVLRFITTIDSLIATIRQKEEELAKEKEWKKLCVEYAEADMQPARELDMDGNLCAWYQCDCEQCTKFYAMGGKVTLPASPNIDKK